MANLITNVNQACADLTNIKKAITDKGVEVANGTPSSEYADKVNEVYDAGKKAGYNSFWDKYLNIESNIFTLAFAGSKWKQEIIDTIPYVLNLGNCQEMFKNNSAIFDLSKFPIRRKDWISNYRQTFYGAEKLHTVWELDFRNNYNVELTGTFHGCTSLANVTVVSETIKQTIDFQWCPLTKASITSVIGGLNSSVTGQTCTLKKSAKEAAFTADEWAALAATKSNWTISLV